MPDFLSLHAELRRGEGSLRAIVSVAGASITLAMTAEPPAAPGAGAGPAPADPPVRDWAALLALPVAMRAGRDLAVPGAISRRLMIGLPEWQESWARLDPSLVPVRVLPDAIDETDLGHSARRTVALSLGGMAGTFTALRIAEAGTLVHLADAPSARFARLRGLSVLRLATAPPVAGPECQVLLAAIPHLLSATHGSAALPPFVTWRDQPGRPVNPDQLLHLLAGGRMAIALAPGLSPSDMRRVVRRDLAALRAAGIALPWHWMPWRSMLWRWRLAAAASLLAGP